MEHLAHSPVWRHATNCIWWKPQWLIGCASINFKWQKDTYLRLVYWWLCSMYLIHRLVWSQKIPLLNIDLYNVSSSDHACFASQFAIKIGLRRCLSRHIFFGIDFFLWVKLFGSFPICVCICDGVCPCAISNVQVRHMSRRFTPSWTAVCCFT